MYSSIKKNLLGNGVMSAGALCFSYALSCETALSPLAGSFVRAIMNLLVSLLLFRLWRRSSPKSPLLGYRRGLLLLWGCFGSLTLIAYSMALDRLGAGAATFLLNTHGSLLLLVPPLLARRLPAFQHLLAGVLCLCGAGFLSMQGTQPEWGDGLFWGMLSGIAAALAYALVGTRIIGETTISMMFYWSLVNLMVHLIFLAFQPIAWPETFPALGMLIVSGTLASLGQYWVTASYQVKNNGLIGLISYLSCVMSMVVEIAFLGKSYGPAQYGGAALILTAGVGSILWLQHENTQRVIRISFPDERERVQL